MQQYAIFSAYVAIVGTLASILAPTPQEAQNINTAQLVAEETPEIQVALDQAEQTPDHVEPKTQVEQNKAIIAEYGVRAFGEAEISALLELVQRESSFNNTAQNPKSTAYGLFQFLDKTWGNYGFEKTSDPVIQTEAGIAYIQIRYGTPSKALRFHKRNGWY